MTYVTWIPPSGPESEFQQLRVYSSVKYVFNTVYQVIVVRDVNVRIDGVEPRVVEDEFGVTDEVDHVGQLGLCRLARCGRQPRQTTGHRTVNMRQSVSLSESWMCCHVIRYDLSMRILPLQILLESPLHDVNHHVDLLDGLLGVGDALRADEQRRHRRREESLRLLQASLAPGMEVIH